MLKIINVKEETIREQLLAVIDACPFAQCKVPDCYCPFHMVRNMSPQDQYVWAKSISEEEALDLIESHALCVEKNIGNLPSFWEK